MESMYRMDMGLLYISCPQLSYAGVSIGHRLIGIGKRKHCITQIISLLKTIPVLTEEQRRYTLVKVPCYFTQVY